MGKKQKLKELRKEIRARFQSGYERDQVAKEMLDLKDQKNRVLKRLYFTSLDPLLFDEANQ